MRSILFLCGMFLYLVITLPLLLLFKLTKDKRIATVFGLGIGRVGNFLAGNKVEVINPQFIENISEPSLIILNHEGIFDAFNLYAKLNTKFGIVSKKENGKIPLLGLWTGPMDVLLMDRDDIRQSMRIIRQASENITNGLSVCIFPEGTRSTEDREFQAGSFKIAEKAKCPIICITMRNTAQVFEKNKRIKSTKTLMHVHKPIAYTEYAGMSTVEIAKKCEDLIYGVKFEK